MTDHSIDPVRVPKGTIVVTPNAEPEYLYQEVNGHRLISVKITDNRVEDVQLLLTPSVAELMGVNLLGMIEHLDTLHAEWMETQHE